MRAGAGYRLERRQILRAPRREVFDFFARAENLERITPDFLRFHIVTPAPIEMRSGARIEYHLRLLGWPLTWRTRIRSFEPPSSFVDVQEHGPYASWVHRHEFREHAEPGCASDACTEMVDTVEYELPFGRLAAPVHSLFLRRALVRIFDHRRDRVSELFDRRAQLA